MALDGFAISNIIYELKQNLIGGRVDKIYQPEKDEITINVRSQKNVYKVLLTANASNPRIHITNIQKENPLNAPLFCMVLRKHLASGKIIDITQPSFERIINIHIESINELGDYSRKILVLEIMGRHSNIILLDNKNMILESIKHIGFDKSSVREILPSKDYTMPPVNECKISPLSENRENFIAKIKNINGDLQSAIYKNYNGISPILATEICNLANINSSFNVCEISDNEINILFDMFIKIINKCNNNDFSPQVIYKENNTVLDFTVFDFTIFDKLEKKMFTSISELLEFFYKTKDLTYRLNQKTQDLRRIITQNIERCVKKKEIQRQMFNEIRDRDTLKLLGELITSNIYSIKKGMTKITVQNFYSENCEDMEIDLNANLTPAENAQKYFRKYNKQKRTFKALKEQVIHNEKEFEYLESVFNSISNCKTENDIQEIRQELFNEGFIKKMKSKKGNKRKNIKSKPMHFVSCDGFNIYVGKNNIQNDELTLKFAKSNDMWLHTKNIAGSHTIIVCSGKEIPETTLNEACHLAVFYSKARNSTSVPVDYTIKKFVKKPSGAKAGMVIYETNKTAYITVDENMINNMEVIE